jgi:Mycotoxin biosynthesis protein UstYa
MINVHAPTFFDNSSIYRQLPSDEVDAAWKRLTPMRRVYLTTEQVIKLGKDPSLTVRDNENPDLHIGILNGMHELHCLDLVRKNLHRDYYWPDGIRNPIHWMHLYHCMDVILHALTCAGNMDVVTFNWMETQRDPFFDFGVEHVCRDFDRILDWQTSSLPMAPEPAAYRVGGEKEIPEHPLLQALHTQNPEDRVFTHNDPAFGGIGL